MLGIVLSRRDIREFDQLIVFYTREKGKIEVLARGIKKILRNFTYIGKVKFSGQILQGKHEAIISPELFNKVQNKLENLGIS